LFVIHCSGVRTDEEDEAPEDGSIFLSTPRMKVTDKLLEEKKDLAEADVEVDDRHENDLWIESDSLHKHGVTDKVRVF